MWLMTNAMKNPEHAGAGATAYMHMMGVVAIGLIWLRMAVAADKALAQGASDQEFLNAKLITARFYAQRIMPDTMSLRRKLEAGADTVMALSIAAF